MILNIVMIKEDIEPTSMGNIHWCPVARALRRELTKQKIDYTLVEVNCVDDITYEVVGEEYNPSYNIALIGDDADKVDTFIGEFDAGNEVQPISFNADVQLAASSI